MNSTRRRAPAGRGPRLPGWFVALTAVMAAQRLSELALSRRRERALPGGTQAAASTYPLMVAVHAALLTLPVVEVAALHRRPRAPLAWIGVLGAATLLRRWSIRTLGASWNARAVVPSDLRPVVDGPYRLIRHPNYLAVVLEFLALPLAGGAWLSAIGLSALNALVLVDRIREEERLLAAIPGYGRALGGRARFIPGLF
jgi:methyltransferase